MGTYSDKVNTTLKQKHLKDDLEVLGHTGVEVWWETLQPATEMCGMGGGYFFHSNQNEHEPLGTSFKEAQDHIQTAYWLKPDRI